MDAKGSLAINPKYSGYLEGHNGAITSIVTGHSKIDDKDNEILVSGSRDKHIMIWKVNQELERNAESAYGEPFLSLTGHNHFISDLSLSSDSTHLLSSSWDRSLRLWSLKTGKCIKRFSHPGQKEILSTAFSQDGRQIFSSGADNKLSLWNTKGEFVLGSDKSNHFDWVSKVRFSPSQKNRFYASVGWDGYLKIWTEFFKLAASVKAHDGPIYALAINLPGKHIATGGKDKVVKLWKVGETDKPDKEFKCDSNIVDLAFHPEMQWIAVATETSVKFYELYNDSDNPDASVEPAQINKKSSIKPKFTSIAWSSNGKVLYAGATDGIIRVYSVDMAHDE